LLVGKLNRDTHKHADTLAIPKAGYLKKGKQAKILASNNNNNNNNNNNKENKSNKCDIKY